MTPTHCQQTLFAEPEALSSPTIPRRREHESLAEHLKGFCEFGQSTRVLETDFRTPVGELQIVPMYVNEYWTARQRQAR